MGERTAAVVVVVLDGAANEANQSSVAGAD